MKNLCLIFLLTFFAFSCSKEDRESQNLYSENIIPEDLQVISRSNLLESDTSIVHLVRLMTVDNKLVTSFLSNDIDTSDVFNIYNQLGLISDTWINEEQVTYINYEDFRFFLQSNYSDNDLVSYFDEILLHYDVLRKRLINLYPNLNSNADQNFKNELISAFTYQMNIIEQDTLIKFRNNEKCKWCESAYEVCRQNAAGTSAGIVSAGIIIAEGIIGVSGYLGPPSWGAAGTAAGGGFVSGGINYLSSLWACRNDLDFCLKSNDCPGAGGRNNRLEEINKN